MRIPSRDACVHVPTEWLQNRDAGGDVAEIDFEDSRHGVRYADPGQIFRFDLPRCSRPGDRDCTRNDAQSHQTAQSDLAPLPDVEVPQKHDWKGGADEVGDEGEDALRDEYVHYHLPREALSGLAQVPGFVHGVALEDV